MCVLCALCGITITVARAGDGGGHGGAPRVARPARGGVDLPPPLHESGAVAGAARRRAGRPRAAAGRVEAERARAVGGGADKPSACAWRRSGGAPSRANGRDRRRADTGRRVWPARLNPAAAIAGPAILAIACLVPRTWTAALSVVCVCCVLSAESQSRSLGPVTEAATAELLASLGPLVEEWISLLRSTSRERSPGQLDAVLDDLGPLPGESRPNARALWVAGLINPLPALGVALEVRPAALMAATADERIRVAEFGLRDSIQRLRSPGPPF
mmetsp:Transcript_12586/g.40944  ORF Transcript_12586/g.40944 Transcript_12586/m.40944 type:complete len:273 (+) Transcript_12586:61-879(+)